MDSKRSSRLTFANVTSVIALFVALGGTATAAVFVTGKNVKNGSLTGRDVKNKSLTGRDVKNSSLGSKKIKNGNLLAKDFKAGQLPRGGQGATGPGGAAGKDGSAGPSDVYATGAAQVALTATPRTEVASLTVPAGSYLLGGSMWIATPGVPGTVTEVSCLLESSEGAGKVVWDESYPAPMPYTAPRTTLSLSGADSFSATQDVKIFCNSTADANAMNVRLWAIKTGNLHANLPLPID
jgi:hypothetical protein